MFTNKCDMHTHTIVSDHAFSTITEITNQCAKVGIELVAITDHGPALPDGAHPWHFESYKLLPRLLNGVVVIRGVELNITDYEGSVDLGEDILKQLDWCIASIHPPCLPPLDEKSITNTYLKAIQNPYVDCLGHSGQGRYKFDYETVVKEVKRLDKVIEINNHSFGIRKGSTENCLTIASLCKQYGVYVVVTSDSHFHTTIGEYTTAFEILKKVNMPNEQILSLSKDKMIAYIENKKQRRII